MNKEIRRFVRVGTTSILTIVFAPETSDLINKYHNVPIPTVLCCALTFGSACLLCYLTQDEIVRRIRASWSSYRSGKQISEAFSRMPADQI